MFSELPEGPTPPGILGGPRADEVFRQGTIPMTKSMKQLEPMIRKLCADHNVFDPKELVSFNETNNLECEIEKKDGSRARILRRLLERCEDDPVAKLQILEKLKSGFRMPKKGE